MNGRLWMVTIAAVALGGAMPLAAQQQQDVESLRGDTPIESESPAPPERTQPGKRDPIPRTFEQQPPLIPHKAASIRITQDKNGCLKCHAPDRVEKSGARVVPASHFKDRDGNALDNVATNRWFCTQCHVEQADAAPLVENDFKTVGTKQ